MSDKNKHAADPVVFDGASLTQSKKTRVVWKCSVCGYVESRYPEGLPDDYRCPICNAKPKKFKRMEIEA